MRFVDTLEKKRNGEELMTEEIESFVQGYTEGTIPDYQASAFLMAIYFQGMTPREQGDLTQAMARSGDVLDLSLIDGVKVDKHSTGGVGDTTTLILVPLVAACGVPVAKMSGRGLGHTGGTLDKLEAIPGFHIERTEREFIEQVNTIGAAVIGQTGNLAPADKKLYALRDVTATVNSIPLIASSIMSKKIASGADAIVLDVKVGDGAFMKTKEEAEELARAMVAIGEAVGRHTSAVISNMDEPLGRAVGNALEVQEAIDTLRGEGPADLTELSIQLGGRMLVAGQRVDTVEEGRLRIREAMDSGRALDVFRQLIEAQGGDASVVDDFSLFAQADYEEDVLAKRDGYVTHIVANEIGLASMKLGAGRATKDDQIDPAVGIVLHKKVGDAVRQGEPIATVYAQSEHVAPSVAQIERAYTIGDERIEPKPLLYLFEK
ncbi:pyrimidine-nucleoside phosphorylase [Planococcaceae bacterium Storch 2/2-2]|nr:pyrimidine-nucleoside phosphorylase [Planococcaceae bacterium Storch 2/2-2]